MGDYDIDNGKLSALSYHLLYVLGLQRSITIKIMEMLRLSLHLGCCKTCFNGHGSVDISSRS